MTNYIGTIAKCLVAALVAFGGAFSVAKENGTIDDTEWITIGIATAIALFAVWAIPNAKESVEESVDTEHS
jgi:hypothetical protein